MVATASLPIWNWTDKPIRRSGRQWRHLRRPAIQSHESASKISGISARSSSVGRSPPPSPVQIIGIDPFDQPDVEASKVKTSALTEAYEKSHSLPKEEPVFRENGVALYADPRNAAELGRHNTLSGYLKSHFGRMQRRRLCGAAALYPA